MPPLPDRMTRRDALGRLAATGVALACSASSRGAVADEKRPPARIYVTSGTLYGEARPEVSGILAIDPKEGTWVQVAPDGNSGARVSPDGRSVLCYRPGKEVGLYLYDVRGEGEPRRVVEGVSTRYFWSPDGKQILHGGGAAGKFARVNLDGTGRVELPIPASDVVFDWSSDGQWLLTRSPRTKDEAAARPTNHSTDMVHPDGTGRRHLVDGSDNHWFDRFSPDGRTVLFTRLPYKPPERPRGPYRIDMIDVDGTNRRTFLEQGDAPDGPYKAVWSPDGQELAVLYREDRGEPGEALRIEDISTRLEIVSADGKARRRLDVLDGVRLSLDDWR